MTPRGLLAMALKALAASVMLPVLFAVALLARIRGRPAQPRLVWGSVPIMNNAYWSRAMRGAGYRSETYTTPVFAINDRSDWDRILGEEWGWLPGPMRRYLAFATSLLRYDVFFVSFLGFFIGETPLRRFQHVLFRVAGKKVVVLPFGGDAYIYRRVRSPSIVQALLMSYPEPARGQARIASDVDYWARWADFVAPGYMGPDGIGRWDVLIPSPSFIDLDLWSRNRGYSNCDGTNGPVTIVHAPNHRGFKGTEFIVDAVSRLSAEGFNVRLVLLEKVKNAEVRRVLIEEADVLVEQLIFCGHGLNGVEGMAAGVTTISNLESEDYILPFRRWSYFDECPIVSATPESIYGTLKRLVVDPGLRRELGLAARAYAEKYHGLDSARYFFGNIINYLDGRREELLTLYHPLLGEYPRRMPKVRHPLLRSRLVGPESAPSSIFS